MKHYLAIDLGATSGRTIIGTLDNGNVSLEELTRFDNTLIALGGHLYWDLYALYNEIIRGLQLTAQRGMDIESIGIDTWGCDFALFGDDGVLLGNPIAYRDPHTNGIVPPIFTAIAFDSGGVASGPMTATFLLPFAMGACMTVGGNVVTDAFGVVTMVAMTPLVAIQCLGLAYKLKSRKVQKPQVQEDTLEGFGDYDIIDL